MAISTSDILTPRERNLLLYRYPPLSRTLDSHVDNIQRFSRRPDNLFAFYRDFQRRLRSQYPGDSYNTREFVTMIADYWRSQPTSVKQYFILLSKLEKQRYNNREIYLGYAFRPRRGNNL